MENRIMYKRIKINWWVIIPFVVTYVWMIFAYIHLWGNSPVGKAGLIFVGIIWIVVWFLIGRPILTIDEKFVTLKTDLWTYVEIHVKQIKDVSIVNMNLLGRVNAKFEKHFFDFVKQAVSIKLKNGKTYQIAIKDAEKIKEEIEKRMITTNKPQ